MRAPLLAAAALIAVAPAGEGAGADPLQDRVLAGMRATDTRDVAFVQTFRSERTGSAASEIVTRHTPGTAPPWSVLRVDGRAPTAKERTDILKPATREPTPSYARVARWFGSSARRVAEAPGRVTYRFSGLPKGTIRMGSHDASADTIADAVVNTWGPQPYVERVRFTSAKPFRMMLVAKVEQYVLNSSYAPLADGRVFPVATDSEFSGSMLGKSGSLRARSRFTEMRAGR